jgi:GNAT superfamily N-acetyltransferase
VSVAPPAPPEAPLGITVRLAREEDAPALAEMVNDFVRGHPAENHARPEQALRAAYFGANPVAEVIVAEWRGGVVGMLQWTRTFDMFWSMFGGVVEWLYVKPHARGLGLSAALLAMVSHRVREAGGEFLHGSGGEHTTSLYRRLASASGTNQVFYLSGEGFQQAADLAGRAPREVVRHFPSPTLSSVPARGRPEAGDAPRSSRDGGD